MRSVITYPDGQIVTYRRMEVYANKKPTGKILFRKISSCDKDGECYKTPLAITCHYGEIELEIHDIINLRMTYLTLQKIGIEYNEIEDGG